uniref:BBP1_C domain-containing protein n=1 Tax=Rhabditophanes sp. KR3021 TaxID=114890 RepID=A0AC35TZG8_9BILA
MVDSRQPRETSQYMEGILSDKEDLTTNLDQDNRSLATTATSYIPNIPSTSTIDINNISQELNNCADRIEFSLEEQKKSRQLIEALKAEVDGYRKKNKATANKSNISNYPHHISSLSTQHLDIHFPMISTSDIVGSVGDLGGDGCHEGITFELPSILKDSKMDVYNNTTTSLYDINHSLNNSHNNEMGDSGLSLNYNVTLDNLNRMLDDEHKKNGYLETAIEMSKLHTETVLIANQQFVNDIWRLQTNLQVCQAERKDDEEFFKFIEKKYRQLVHFVYVEAHKLSHFFNELYKEVRQYKEETQLLIGDFKYQNRELNRKMEQKLMDSIMDILKKKNVESSENENLIEMMSKKFEDMSLESIKKEQELYDSQMKIIHLEANLRKIKDDRNRAYDTLYKISQIPEIEPSKREALLVRRNDSLSSDSKSTSITYHDNDPFVINFADYNATIRLAFKELKSSLNGCSDENTSLKLKIAHLEADVDNSQKMRTNYEQQLSENSSHTDNFSKLKSDNERIVKKLDDKINLLESEKEEKQIKINELINEISEINTKHQVNISEIFERQKSHVSELMSQYENDNCSMANSSNSKLLRYHKENEHLSKEIEQVRAEFRDEQAEHLVKTRKVHNLESVIHDKERQIAELKESVGVYIKDSDNDNVRILQMQNDYQIVVEEVERLKSQNVDCTRKNKNLTQDVGMFKNELMETQNKLREIGDLNAKLQNTNHELQIEVQNLTNERDTDNQKLSQYSHLKSELESNIQKLSAKEKAYANELHTLKIHIEQNQEAITIYQQEKNEQLIENDKIQSTLQECEEKMLEDDRLIDELTVKIEADSKTLRDLTLANKEYEIKLLDIEEKYELSKGEIEIKENNILTLKTEIEECEMKWGLKLAENSDSFIKQIRIIKEETESVVNQMSEEIRISKQRILELDGESSSKEHKILKLEREIVGMKEHFDSVIHDYEGTIHEKQNEVSHLINKREADTISKNESYHAHISKLETEIGILRNDNKEIHLRLDEEITLYENMKTKYDHEHKANKDNYSLIQKLNEQLEDCVDKLHSFDQTLVMKSDLEKHVNRIKSENAQYMETINNERDTSTQLSSTLIVVEKKLAQNNLILKEYEEKVELLEARLNEKEQLENKLKANIANMQNVLSEERKINEELFHKSEKLEGELATFRNSFKHNESDAKTNSMKISELDTKLRLKTKQLDDTQQSLHEIDEKLILQLKKVDECERIFGMKTKELQNVKEELNLEKEKSYLLTNNSNELEKLKRSLQNDNEQLRKILEQEKSNLTFMAQEYNNKIVHLDNEKFELIKRHDEKVIEVEVLKSKYSLLKERLTKTEDKYVKMEDECLMYANKLKELEGAFEEATNYISSYDNINSTEFNDKCPAGYSDCKLPIITGQNVDLKKRHRSVEKLSDKSKSIRTRSTFQLHHSANSDFAQNIFELYKKRISELEHERTQNKAQIQALSAELNKLNENWRNAEHKIRETESDIIKLRDERVSLENNLRNSRQLYLAQEENTRVKDLEKRQLKAKIQSVDLHTRDKEARIAYLTSTIASLQQENTQLKSELENINDRERHLEYEKVNLEGQLHNIRNEMEITRHELTSVDKEKQTIMTTFQNVYRRSSKSVDTTENAVSLVAQFKELEKLINNKKGLLQRLENEEIKRIGKTEYKNTQVEIMQLEARLETFKIEFSSLVEKFKNCESEKDFLRKELLEYKHQLSTAKIRINDMQINITNLTAQKKKAEDMLMMMEKKEKDVYQMKSELYNDVNHMKSDRLKLIGEIEEYKRRLLRCEIEKRELEAQRSRLEREKTALVRSLESVELEKQKLEGVNRKSVMEKSALEKSLSTVEKENAELYKNVNMLRGQMGQLEKERNAKFTEANFRRKTQAELENNKLMEEKRQSEKMYNQRDHNYTKRIQGLEQEIAGLKVNIEIERKRRLDQLKSISNSKNVTSSSTRYESISYKNQDAN